MVLKIQKNSSLTISRIKNSGNWVVLGEIVTVVVHKTTTIVNVFVHVHKTARYNVVM